MQRWQHNSKPETGLCISVWVEVNKRHRKCDKSLSNSVLHYSPYFDIIWRHGERASSCLSSSARRPEVLVSHGTTLFRGASKSWPEWWGSWRCRERLAAPVCSSCGGTACRNPADAGRPRPGSGSEWTAAPLCLHPRCRRWWGSISQHRPATAPPVRLLRHEHATGGERSTRATVHSSNTQMWCILKCTISLQQIGIFMWCHL